jgi:hypothetical protein
MCLLTLQRRGGASGTFIRYGAFTSGHGLVWSSGGVNNITCFFKSMAYHIDVTETSVLASIAA